MVLLFLPSSREGEEDMHHLPYSGGRLRFPLRDTTAMATAVGTFFVTHHQPGRSRRLHFPAYRQRPSTIIPFSSESSLLVRYLNPSSQLFDDVNVASFSVPLIVIVAAILAFSAQSWINSLIGGEQGLGAYLSDGSGYNKSAFKQRKRSSKGGEDPLPWLNLPEFDFVDVAGQTKKSTTLKQSPIRRQATSAIERDPSEVLFQLDLLRAQIKMEVELGNLEAAKEVEIRLERLMKEEGYDFSLRGD
jgi:hypothetical protein